MKLKFGNLFPKKFTLKNDWKDGGDYDKSIGVIHKSLFAGILLVVLFAKVFKEGIAFNEIIGFSLLTAAAAWASGLIKLEIVEGEKTMYNTWILIAATLTGALILFA